MAWQDICIHIPGKTVFFPYLATICCIILKFFKYQTVFHIPLHLLFREAGCFPLSVLSIPHLGFFSFHLFLPIFSTFCQYHSVKHFRCLMGNDKYSFNPGNVVGPKIYIIHIACSRENCFIISIFILGRFIHAVRLGEHLDRGVDTVISQECFRDVGDKDINELLLSLSSL